jgi:hypothetical protein
VELCVYIVPTYTLLEDDSECHLWCPQEDWSHLSGSLDIKVLGEPHSSDYWGIDLLGLRSAVQLKKLYLDVSESCLTNISAISSLKHLKMLSLVTAADEYTLPEEVAELRHLQELAAPEAECSDELWERLASLPDLLAMQLAGLDMYTSSTVCGVRSHGAEGPG